MPTLLSDPATSTTLLALIVAAAGAFGWYRTQTKKSARVAAACAAVPVALFLCDFLAESPREEAVRRTEELVAAFNAASPDGVAAQLSDRFRYGTTTKATARAAPIWALIREHGPRVAVWDFDRAYVDYPSPDEIRIGCMVKVEPRNHPPGIFYFRPTFVQEAGGYRVRTFDVHTDAMQKANGPVFNVPGLP